jgi:hypothetical protein
MDTEEKPAFSGVPFAGRHLWGSDAVLRQMHYHADHEAEVVRNGLSERAGGLCKPLKTAFRQGQTLPEVTRTFRREAEWRLGSRPL